MRQRKAIDTFSVVCVCNAILNRDFPRLVQVRKYALSNRNEGQITKLFPLYIPKQN